MSLSIMILLIAAFAAGALYAGRSYGKIGTLVVAGVGFTFIYGLYALGVLVLNRPGWL
jgi:hypothetical protein